MKAFRMEKVGGTPNVVDTPIPEPDQSQVRLRIAACGLNFGDLLMIKGTYQEAPPTPYTLGMEVAGTIDALGGNGGSHRVGDRVAVYAGSGGLAEFGCFETAHCLKLPNSMSFEEGAAFQVAYGTSHLALDHRAQLKQGETLLVLGAAGGVGLAAIEIGKLMGATVIAVARGADKLAIAKKAGADHLINSETQDLREVVKSLGGADVVYDPVGGEQFKSALRSCNPEARVIIIGFASGDVPQIPANIILVKNITVIGYYWGGYNRFAPEVLINSLTTLFGWYEQGKLKPHISYTLPLEKTAEALELLRTRKSTGKVIVTP